MIISILTFSLWVAAICVVADIQLHPIRTEDLQNIVDSVKRDVDRHLKVTGNWHPKASSVLKETETEESGVVDINNLMEVIQNSIHEHLEKNLGTPDVENSGSTENMFASLNRESDPGPSTKNTDESAREPSSEMYKVRVGSAKGVPGINFPDYTEIPITSFTCSDKTDLPGFYADLDTGCQVFHVCWPNRRESFLCPLGTIFNQALRVCDYWYNSNCSLAPYYYTEEEPDETGKGNKISMINTLLEKMDSSTAQKSESSSNDATVDILSFVSQFMPVKAKIVVYPETSSQRLKIVTSATIGKTSKGIKSRQKNLSSKHSRVPRSTEHVKPLAEDSIIEELSQKVTAFRVFEGIEKIVTDIKNDKNWSKLSRYADRIAEFIKYWFFMGETPERVNVEPGSELHALDIEMHETMEDLQITFKKFMILVAKLMYEFDTRERFKIPETSEEFREHFKRRPLINLNPKFIVKSATEQMRARRSATVLNHLKLSHKDPLSIHSGTKKILLKNYLKLFKTKRE